MLRAIERPPARARRGPAWLVLAWPTLAVLVLLFSLRLGLPGVLPGPLDEIAGLGLVLVVPVALLRHKIDWPVRGSAESWLLSVVTAILGLLIVGLVINYLLPMVGIERPLDRGPVLVAIAVGDVALALWRPDRAPALADLLRWSGSHSTRSWGARLVAMSAVALLVSIVGAVRLNNGASGAVALAALVLWIGIIAALLIGSRHLGLGSKLTVIYLLAAAFLLMTSLRGWYVTGHDIQYEYQVFQLTSNLGLWQPHTFRSAYYACLSITILPTVLAHVTGLSGVLVFKVVIQLLFALCPLMVFLIGRRVVSDRWALIGVTYFLLFPTFFSDMPFLTRQETAFLFFAAAIMLLLSQDVPAADTVDPGGG